MNALVDVTMLRQVFFNIAANALDAMPEGGVLRVGIEPSAVGARTPQLSRTIRTRLPRRSKRITPLPPTWPRSSPRAGVPAPVARTI